MSTAPIRVQCVKNFVSLHQSGILSTLSKASDGYPFGSITPYDINTDGEVVISISKISEHYKNLMEDSRSSLFIADRFGRDDPQSYARATLLGRFAPIDSESVETISASYYARFPKAPQRNLAHDFEFFKLSPERVRWIGGFGDIRWISAKDYLSAEFDDVAYVGRSIIDHMNEDHGDVLEIFAKVLTPHSPPYKSVKMVGIDRSQFVIAIEAQDAVKREEIKFPETTNSSKNVREAMIVMLKDCRERNSD